jgi:ABC-2 type transport system permease protein
VIGIAMGYLVLVEAVFARALQSAQPWLLQLNFKALVQHGARYSVNSCTTDAQGRYSCQDVEKFLQFAHSTTYLSLLVVLIVTLAALVF